MTDHTPMSQSGTQPYVCSGCGETVPGPRPPRQYCAWTRRAETMTPAVAVEREEPHDGR